MKNWEWPAEDYAVGSFIQASIAAPYLDALAFESHDKVLDIGCGDGGFTTRILDKLPQGQVLGIDASINMVNLAKKHLVTYPNFSVKVGDVATMDYHNAFDKVLSFWCLQWSRDAVEAIDNMGKALKPDGQLLVICPTGEEDPYLRAFHAVRDTQVFPELDTFSAPSGYNNFANLAEKLAVLPFSTIKCERIVDEMVLPSLDVYAKFVNGIALFHGYIAPERIQEINAAMVKDYHHYCQTHYEGKYVFEIAIYKISAVK